ncbi:MAG: SAM-dependent methyltransferase [Clostridium sp.]|jgi:SAM-dependent methyltransferase|nr:SAM-dependent methyltransferase [Clostridium sp.]
MEELRKLLEKMLNEELEQIILSGSTSRETVSKIKIRPVRLKGELFFQETKYCGTQVFHSNHPAPEMRERIEGYLSGWFRQAELRSLDCSAIVLAGKKGRMNIKVKHIEQAREGQAKARDLEHDRVKTYLLEDGRPVDFLVALGVQTPEGRVVKGKYDKFRQLNRYLEFIEDVLKELPADRPIRILDFGCGKSYLTFAMYHYLHERKGRKVRITGLDLKEAVIEDCNRLAEKCGYQYLKFEKGDIRTYTGAEKPDGEAGKMDQTAGLPGRIDMVVTLHACDLATDYALEKAVKWGAKVILAVPCCQHELNRQLSCEVLAPILRYGIIKERISALVTDALRANLLKEQGYEVQILEFIDMEHTRKNLLIRGVKKQGMSGKQAREDHGRESNRAAMEFLGVSPTLRKLLEPEDGAVSE